MPRLPARPGEPTQREHDHDVPESLAEYRIVRELGSGAMGRVFLADRDGERLALKVLHPHLLLAKGFFRRFQHEARAGTAVDHRNVARVLGCDFVMSGDRPWSFLVMEYVEGRTLRSLLRDVGACPESLVRDVARQVASGLAAVHAAGIVHRDIKPDNLMIGPDRRVRVMDLGIARLLDGTTRLTTEGQFAGSLLYASPEQLKRIDPGPTSDLYSLGVVLHELAAGRNPFHRRHAGAILDAHLLEPAPRLRDAVPEVSPFLAAVVDTLLAKDPAARFESAALLRDVLTEGEDSAWWRVRSGGEGDGAG